MGSFIACTHKFGFFVLCLQILLFIVYGTITDYSESIQPKNWNSDNSTNYKNDELRSATYFQNVHVMVIFGIGFLLTFLQKYGYSAVGMNIFLCSLSIEVALIIQQLWNLQDGKLRIDLTSLTQADVAAAGAVIALGAVLGKVGPLQMVVFTVAETVFFSTNQHYSIKWLQVADEGGAVSLHLFCGIFGLATTFVVDRKKCVQHNPNECTSITSNIFCMVGTLFLWALWPSFNAALAPSESQELCLVNTYLALVSSCIVAFATSSILDTDQKFNIVHVQNSTLAGGVAISSATNLLIHPVGALSIGGFAGIISVLGYSYVAPFLSKRAKIHDPCGISSLHAIPGAFGGIVGAILVLMASEQNYGNSLYFLYPAMVPSNITELQHLQYKDDLQAGSNRSTLIQAAFQLLYTLATILTATITGAITGLLMRLQYFDPLETKHMYIDEPFWKLPDTITSPPLPSVTADNSTQNGGHITTEEV